ncbi:MAG: CRISPR-associated protein Cas4 [Desulfobacterales bacterium]|nr:CRISPR-associated protein Cas4 [Desulfobacterales bacterium]
MIYSEDDFISISALAHFLYCNRRCALIHIEQIWTENLFTAEGRIMHEHVHQEGYESRGNIYTEHGVPLKSLRLGLIGKADLIEFHLLDKEKRQPYPVEYKRGKPKKDNSDKVQLCAQAICLEEMQYVDIPEGALYYGKNRRRQTVIFDNALREETAKTAERVHVLINSGITPAAVYSQKCDSCSLFEICMPKVINRKQTVEKYLRSMQRP